MILIISCYYLIVMCTQNVSNELLRMVTNAGFVTSLTDMLRAWNSRSLSSAFKDILNAAELNDLISSVPSPALVCVPSEKFISCH